MPSFPLFCKYREKWVDTWMVGWVDGSFATLQPLEIIFNLLIICSNCRNWNQNASTVTYVFLDYHRFPVKLTVGIDVLGRYLKTLAVKSSNWSIYWTESKEERSFLDWERPEGLSGSSSLSNFKHSCCLAGYNNHNDNTWLFFKHPSVSQIRKENNCTEHNRRQWSWH